MIGEYQCPICGRPGELSRRYSRCKCVECGHRATDVDGRRVRFTNESISGGCLAFYRDNDEPYDSHICYVDGLTCWADEAHMGGIVVSIYDETVK